VDYVNLHGGFRPNDMPPCLDLEWDRTKSNPDQWSGRAPDEIVNSALAWLKRVEERTNRTPILYTARSWWRDRKISEEKFALFNKYRIWIADYSRSHKATESPAVPLNQRAHLWQFAEDAKLTTGYRGALDANIYKGTENDFVSDFGLPK
jgi:lysozyme